MNNTLLKNYINGQWRAASTSDTLDVTNPATGETLAQVPLSPPGDVDAAAQAAADALPGWRRTPPGERIQYLFKLKTLLEAHFEEISRIITMECGKTLNESRGEMQRAIDREIKAAKKAEAEARKKAEDEIKKRLPGGLFHFQCVTTQGPHS